MSSGRAAGLLWGHSGVLASQVRGVRLSGASAFRFKWKNFRSGAIHPWTLNMPSEKGFEWDPTDEDTDVPWAQRWTDLKRTLGEETRALQRTLRRRRRTFRSDARMRETDFMRHGDAMIEFPFAKAETFARFSAGSDKDVHCGFSECELVPSDRGTALFRGNLDTTVPDTGTVDVTGWASMKSETVQRPFTHSVASMEDWEIFTHIMLKVRGDGRTYMLNLNCADQFDASWADLWTHPIFTHGGPYWQIVKIPFSKFFFTAYGRIQPNQRAPVEQDEDNPDRWNIVRRQQHLNAPIRAVGITLQDRIDGPFNLEIDWIGVYFDITHFEICKYEHYSTKWFSIK